MSDEHNTAVTGVWGEVALCPLSVVGDGGLWVEKEAVGLFLWRCRSVSLVHISKSLEWAGPACSRG